MDTPEILYHYTDAKGLHGILNSKQIWASSYRFMSDTREFQYGFDLISELYPGKYLLQGLFPSLHSNFQEANFAELIGNWKMTHDYDGLFVASFSAVGDLLGQWRGYAGLHSGYALGFWSDDLKSINSETGLIACSYNKQQQLEELKRLIEKYLPTLSKIVSSTSPNSIDLLSLATEAAQEMPLLCSKFKHPAFEEEKEWRLVVGPLPGNSGRICYRPGERVIIPYVEIDFKTTGLPLKRIIVGPGPHQIRNVGSLRQMLIVQGFTGVEVLPSEVPFRTW